jgi:hypothetical protein
MLDNKIRLLEVYVTKYTQGFTLIGCRKYKNANYKFLEGFLIVNFKNKNDDEEIHSFNINEVKEFRVRYVNEDELPN